MKQIMHPASNNRALRIRNLSEGRLGELLEAVTNETGKTAS